MESVGLNLLGRELRAYLFARMCLPPPPTPQDLSCRGRTELVLGQMPVS